WRAQIMWGVPPGLLHFLAGWRGNLLCSNLLWLPRDRLLRRQDFFDLRFGRRCLQSIHGTSGCLRGQTSQAYQEKQQGRPICSEREASRKIGQKANKAVEATG